jgi:D-2-hydroxyacid dehydrogenase (NADP+)
LTIVGFGAVGQHLARVAVALGMHVRAVSRTGNAHGPGHDDIEVVPITKLGEAIADAAFLVVAVPLTNETRNLIDRQVIARLRRDAYVINVARGGVVDETALTDALTAGRIAGAALDVFAVEPLPSDSALWSTPRLTITPHVAGLGEAYIERCVDALLQNVGALEGQMPLAGLVNRDAGY